MVRLRSLGKRIRPLDKLFDVAALAIEKEDLMQSSKINEVFDALNTTNDTQLKREVKDLCNYVPYRLLAYLWPSELKGKTDRIKNQLIEEYSRSEQKCVYAIYSISQKEKIIEVNDSWVDYISINRERLLMWINKKIGEFVRKE